MSDNLSQEPEQSQEVEVQAVEELQQEQPTIEEQQEVEQSVSESESDESVEDFYLIGDEEVTLSTINEWKNGHMMQSDYSKKTQEVSEDRKKLTKEREQITTKANQLDSLISELETELVASESDEDMDALLDVDPSEFLRREKQNKAKRERIESLKAKANKARQSVSQEQMKIETDKLLKANPDWVDSTGATTEKYQTDMTMIDNYLNERGYSAQDKADITSSKHWLTIQDAAKYQASKSKVEDVTGQAKKAQRVQKPTKGKSGIDVQIAQARAELKRTGSDQAFMVLDKLIRSKGKK